MLGVIVFTGTEYGSYGSRISRLGFGSITSICSLRFSGKMADCQRSKQTDITSSRAVRLELVTEQTTVISVKLDDYPLLYHVKCPEGERPAGVIISLAAD